MRLDRIAITNLLSFGPDGVSLPLRPLNVLIGPNGSGKSNFIESLAILHAAPGNVAGPIQQGGGILNWLWKGSHDPHPNATIVADMSDGRRQRPLTYRIAFTAVNAAPFLTDERLEDAVTPEAKVSSRLHFGYENGKPMLRSAGRLRELPPKTFNTQDSVLAQRRDPDQYPQLTRVGEYFASFSIYANSAVAAVPNLRIPQGADLSRLVMSPDMQNVALVVNRLMQDPNARADLLRYASMLGEDVLDIGVDVDQGRVSLMLHERQFVVPAVRMSGGAWQWICLIAILLNPSPPPLVCIDEPELGLHPDLIHKVADLLREAAERTQVIVTTHSAELVDAMSDTPECIIVCDKENGATVMRRLEASRLAKWLERYSLGELWQSGELGGSRW